jgi:hypothetical protein
VLPAAGPTTTSSPEGTADAIGPAARRVQSSCGYLSPVRRQMLVGMKAATAGGGVCLLADGNQAPVLALLVWQVPHGRECW